MVNYSYYLTVVNMLRSYMIVCVIVQTSLRVPLGIKTKYKAKVTDICSNLDTHNKFIPLEEI